MTTHAAGTDAVRRLNALVAGLLELPADLRGPTLRQYLEQGLERMQAIEQEHFAFLGECAMLAAQNMQDLRLRDLEQRVDAIEHPPPTTFGEAMLAVALDVALQAGTLYILSELAVVAVAYFGLRATAAAVRAGFQDFAPIVARQRVLAAEARLANGKRMVESASASMQLIFEKVLRGDVPAGGFKLSIDIDESRTVTTVGDWLSVNGELADRRVSLGDQLLLARQAVLGNDDKALPTYTEALDAVNDQAIAEYSAQWREFISGEKGGLVTDPMQALLDQANTQAAQAIGQAVAAPDGRGRVEPFLGSTTTGRFLSYASEKRLEVGEAYAALRFYVRYATDTAMRTDGRIASIARMVAQALPGLERLRAMGPAARGMVVLGFEGAFWLEYLRTDGALEVVPETNYVGEPDLPVGGFIDGFVIEGPAVDFSKNPQWVEWLPAAGLIGVKVALRLRSYRARFYCGVGRLTELQAEALYHRFAKPFFADASSRALVPLPFTYEPGAYDLLSAEQPRLWEGLLTSDERRARLDEMRLMVILYFLALQAGLGQERLDALLGQGAAASVRQWTANLSTGVVPGMRDGEAATLASLEASGGAWRALLASIGATESDALRLARLELHDALTDLNQDIWAYQLLASGAVEVDLTVDRRTPDELRFEIAEQQGMLEARYQALLALAGPDPAAADALETLYGSAVSAIAAWQPGEDWVWYGPDRP